MSSFHFFRPFPLFSSFPPAFYVPQTLLAIAKLSFPSLQLQMRGRETRKERGRNVKYIRYESYSFPLNSLHPFAATAHPPRAQIPILQTHNLPTSCTFLATLSPS
jgi:hypothetical protein